jgi:hypothetical protein
MSCGWCSRCNQTVEVKPHTPWWATLFGPLGFILFGSLRCSKCNGYARLS